MDFEYGRAMLHFSDSEARKKVPTIESTFKDFTNHADDVEFWQEVLEGVHEKNNKFEVRHTSILGSKVAEYKPISIQEKVGIYIDLFSKFISKITHFSHESIKNPLDTLGPKKELIL